MPIIVRILDLIFDALILIIVVGSFLTFFVPPWNPIRSFLDQIIAPLLAPIRRFVRPIGGLDLSPIVFILLVYIVRSILFSIL
ncbi:YggT family protein [bacterium]|nr:MAG: YggT family protein [bacterium]